MDTTRLYVSIEYSTRRVSNRYVDQSAENFSPLFVLLFVPNRIIETIRRRIFFFIFLPSIECNFHRYKRLKVLRVSTDMRFFPLYNRNSRYKRSSSKFHRFTAFDRFSSHYIHSDRASISREIKIYSLFITSISIPQQFFRSD